MTDLENRMSLCGEVVDAYRDDELRLERALLMLHKLTDPEAREPYLGDAGRPATRGDGYLGERCCPICDEEEVLGDATPICVIDLSGAPRHEFPFRSLKHLMTVTDVISGLYVGRRTKPYRMNFYAYRWLSKCSNHNRKLLMELRTRGLILGCDDA